MQAGMGFVRYASWKGIYMICKREWDMHDMQAGMGFAVICKLEWDLR